MSLWLLSHPVAGGKLLGASLQLLKSQLGTQRDKTAFPWGPRSPPGLAG